jgi:hypothetical protein
MNDCLTPGLDVGMLLHLRDTDEWAKIIKIDEVFGIRWCKSTYRCDDVVMGSDACLEGRKFDNTWKIAGSVYSDEIPESLKNYEPPNNQGRTHCFWHPDINTKSKYIKKFDIFLNYCPKCNR